MELYIDLQLACEHSAADPLPSIDDLQLWVGKALAHPLQGEPRDQAELTIRIVDNAESQSLNRDYRGKDKPTNVLSFPTDMPDEWPPELKAELPVGDLVVSAAVVADEAREQGKSLQAHWAHMIVHGSLHLLGYDHIEEAEAVHMEALETKLLGELGFPAPYQDED